MEGANFTLLRQPVWTEQSADPELFYGFLLQLVRRERHTNIESRLIYIMILVADIHRQTSRPSNQDSKHIPENSDCPGRQHHRQRVIQGIFQPSLDESAQD